MMNAHYSRATTPIPDDAVRPVGVGVVIDLGRRGGRLRVLAGRVWITSAGDADDHVLAAGESMRVPAARTLVETWGPDGPALIDWHAGTVTHRLACALRRRSARWWGGARRAVLPAVGVASVVAAGVLVGAAPDAHVTSLAGRLGAAPVLQNGDLAAARPARRLADGGWNRERS